MKETKEIIIGLKKAKTHLGKVIDMVESKEYCVDIMQQTLAIRGLLKSVRLFEIGFAHFHVAVSAHLVFCFRPLVHTT